MKTKLLLTALLGAAIAVNAQYISTSGTAPSPGQIYRAGDGTGSLHFTGTGCGGVLIQSKNGDRALLELQSPSSGGSANRTIFQTLASATYFDVLGSNVPLYFMGSGNNITIGDNSAPSYKVHLKTSAFNDGIAIEQTSTDASALHMINSNTGGEHWALFSTGSNNSQGGGKFSIYQYGETDRLIIDGGTGNVGIGTSFPNSFYRLHTENNSINGNAAWQQSVGFFDANISNSSSSTVNHVIGVKGNVRANSGIYANGIGVQGESYIQSTAINSNFNIGVEGIATGGSQIYGVHGNANSTAANPNANSFGVTGEANAGNGNAFGIEGYASVANPMVTTKAAGMFWGDINCNGTWYTSDRRFKRDVKPLTNTLMKIKQLKPSTYMYKTDEYKGMNFSEEQQIGFIAQEVEEVFPNLIKNMKNMAHPDPNASSEEKGKRVEIGDYKAVNYVGLIPILISGIQEQQSLIEQQNTRLLDQEMELKEQKQLISDLQKKIDGTTGINDVNGANGFSMNQNEPNPFSGETTIKYTLPQSIVTAKLLIYDLSGKQIASFPIEQKGSSSITINSEKLAAGLYIYSVVADGKVVDTKRMVVADK